MIKTRTTTNVMFFVLLTITFAMTLVSLIECYNVRRYISQEKLYIEQMICENINSEIQESQLSTIYESYYANLQDKADSTIDKIIAFVGCVFSVTTIVNTITALKLPKYYDKKQEELEKMVLDAYSYAKEAKAYAKTMGLSNSKVKTREKINSLTTYILDEDTIESSELYFVRGCCYDDISEFENAERDYKQAKKNGLSLDRYYNAMGVLYTKRLIYAKRRNERYDVLFKKSKDYYQKSIDYLKSKNADASDNYCNLACLYQDVGLHNDAIRTFELAIEENEFNATIYFNRAISYEERGTEYYKEAYDDYSFCLKLEPDHSDARNYRITLIFKMLEMQFDKELLDTAKEDIAILKRDINQLDYYESKVNSFNNAYIDDFLKRIDQKIAELEKLESEEEEDED